MAKAETGIELGVGDPLAQAIDRKIWQSPRVVKSKDDIKMVHLESPVSAFGPTDGMPSIFSDGMPTYPQDSVRVYLVTSPAKKIVSVSVSPQDLTSPMSLWRVEMPSGAHSDIEFRRGYEHARVPLVSEHLPVLLSIIEHAGVKEKSIEEIQEGFKMRVRGIWTKKELRWGEQAVTMAHLHHFDQRRQSGELYIDHPWAVVSEMLEWPELAKDSAMIIAGWPHDVPEDSLVFRQPKIDPVTGKAPVTFEVWEKGLEEVMALNIGAVAAKYDMLLARPQPDGWNLKNKDDSNALYYERLRTFPQVVIIKGFDRLHNARTLWAMPDANQRATVTSTKRNYIPMIKEVRAKYPQVVDYLVFELEKALRPIAEGQGMDYDSI